MTKDAIKIYLYNCTQGINLETNLHSVLSNQDPCKSAIITSYDGCTTFSLLASTMT